MLKKLLFVIYLLPLFIPAQNFPTQPDNYVTDRAALLSAEEQKALNAKLSAYEAKTSTQFFVYITDSLKGGDMGQVCQEIFHTWKIGSEKNNGLLIAVFVAEHKFRVHTGYSLEGALPDLATKHIQDDVMRPLFKEGNYYAGLDTGIDALIAAVGKEYVATEKSEKSDYTFLYAFIINFIFLLLILYVSKKRWPDNAKRRRQVMTVAFICALLPFVGVVALLILLIIVRIKPIQGRFAASGNEQNSYFVNDRSSGWSSDSDSSSGSSSDSSFDGGGGGDSGGGGSDSSW